MRAAAFASATAFTKANDITRTANIAFFVMPITAAGQQSVYDGEMGLTGLEGQNEQVPTAYSMCIRIIVLVCTCASAMYLPNE
jgi:hypothetical protein